MYFKVAVLRNSTGEREVPTLCRGKKDQEDTFFKLFSWKDKHLAVDPYK